MDAQDAFFLRMIFLTLRSAGAATSVVVVIRSMEVSSISGSIGAMIGFVVVSVSLMFARRGSLMEVEVESCVFPDWV